MVAEEVSSAESRPVAHHTSQHAAAKQWRTAMVANLLASLDTVLSFLHSCMETYFVAATQSTDGTSARSAAQAVHATLGELPSGILVCT